MRIGGRNGKRISLAKLVLLPVRTSMCLVITLINSSNFMENVILRIDDGVDHFTLRCIADLESCHCRQSLGVSGKAKRTLPNTRRTQILP